MVRDLASAATQLLGFIPFNEQKNAGNDRLHTGSCVVMTVAGIIKSFWSCIKVQVFYLLVFICVYLCPLVEIETGAPRLWRRRRNC
jgi:hypothetical protein